MGENTRLSGHELDREGMAYAKRGGRMMLVRSGGYWGTGGVGQAKCSCGTYSPVLTSGTKRKQWHREHKDEMRQANKGENS